MQGTRKESEEVLKWEELCDGCGLCCNSNRPKTRRGFACPALDVRTRRCTSYETRLDRFICLKVTPENTLDLHQRGILPDSCAYVRHELGLPPVTPPEVELVPFDLAPKSEQRRYMKARDEWQRVRAERQSRSETEDQ